jgi:hypothetical protein
MSEKLQSLIDARNSASDALYEVEKARREKKDRLIDEVNQSLEAEFNEVIIALSAKVDEAKKLLDEERSRIAKASQDHPYPLGTLMYEYNVGKLDRKKFKTGKEGIFEIVTNETQFPANIAYRKEIGKYIVRVLKKDGTPGLKIETNWELYWEPKDESIKRREEDDFIV